MDVAEHELQALYTWVDDIPLSRPKRNIARDFSDGVLMAEVVHHFFPKLVELHNYSSANSFQQKMYNWNTLNAKVFKRLGFIISKPDCEDVANCVASAVERVLKLLRTRIDSVLQEDDRNNGPVMQSYAQPPPAAVGAQRPQAGPQVPAYNTAFNNTAAVLPMVPAMTAKMQASLSAEVLAEREQTINELRETNQILETKVRKLEQLVRLKDAKIQTLQAKLTAAGLA